MKKIGIGLATFALLLVGCGKGSSEERYFSCSMGDWSSLPLTVEVEAEGDLITDFWVQYSIDIEYELDEESQDEVVAEIEEKYSDYSGLLIDVNFSGTYMNVYFTFDSDNLDDLPSDFEGFDGNDIKEKAAGSLIKGLEDYGYDCSEGE